jgi:hypothetical protein
MPPPCHAFIKSTARYIPVHQLKSYYHLSPLHSFSAYRSLNLLIEHFNSTINHPLSATRPHLIITHHHQHHDIFINIATQNVGGLKTESERGSGPKISVLRSLVKKKLDFFVLTEARVDVRAVQKLKLRRDLHVTMHSLHQRP